MKKILLFITLLPIASNTFTQQHIRPGTKEEAAEMQPLPAGTPAAFMVKGEIALHSLMSLSDAHLLKVADALKILSATDALRSGNWDRIRTPLAEVARMNVPAVYWFARQDGSYWTLGQGRVKAKLADREYFPHLLAGEAVIGQLVVSRSTNRNTAIVAVPVHGRNNSVVGALGCSIHLDSLSALVRNEMGPLDDTLFFYSFDAKPLVALHADPAIIFIEPMKQDDEGLREAFTEMLARKVGVVKYNFRGVLRTVIYGKSPLTGWWYGFGKRER